MKPLPAPPEGTPSFDEIRAAVGRLTPKTERLFGTMAPGEMLHHCARFTDLYLGRIAVKPWIRFAARLVGPLFLRRVMKTPATETPKNLKTLPQIRAREDDGADFDQVRGRFLESLGAAEALKGTLDHALYGKMDAESAKGLVRHHTAHHLHQFGLLR